MEPPATAAPVAAPHLRRLKLLAAGLARRAHHGAQAHVAAAAGTRAHMQAAAQSMAQSPQVGPYTAGFAPMRYGFVADALELPAGLSIRNGALFALSNSPTEVACTGGRIL